MCRSNEDEKKRVSSMALALGLSTGNAVLDVGVTKEAS